MVDANYNPTNFCSDARITERSWSVLRYDIEYNSQIGGKVYRTPINVFRVSNGFIIALTYSSQSEWVKDVLAAGGCELKTRGKEYQLSSPNVVHDPTRRRFPIPVRLVLRIVGADEYMELAAR